MTFVLGVTGQRSYNTRPPERDFGRDKIYAGVAWYIANKGCTRLISGMAEGVDLWAAQASQLNKIELFAALPFPGEVQSHRWSPEMQDLHRELLATAVDVFIQSPEFSMAAYNQRNAYIVEHSDEMLVVTNGAQKGGTWNCIKLIAKAGTKAGTVIHTSRRSVQRFENAYDLCQVLGVDMDRLTEAA
jgi:uncharacterized phage-like protein YoqJ